MILVPKKSLSQNFLLNKKIIKNIVDLGEISNESIIIEIGPGTGNLTEEILKKKPNKFFAIEKDQNLSIELKNKFQSSLDIINEDVLTINWNRFSKNSGGTLVEKCCHHFDLMRLITKSEVTSVFATGAQDNNHLDESYNGEKPDILDNAFVIVNFENGARGMLDLCMFAENSKVQEEICGVGHKGKIETSVPSNASGKHSSDLSIGIRGSNEILTQVIEVDKEILKAGSHHGSTFYEHKHFINAIQNNTSPEVSLDDGLKAVAIGQAAQLSIIEKRVVLLSELL